MGAYFEKFDQIFSEFVIIRMLEYGLAFARPWKSDLKNVSHLSFRAVGHHDYAVGEEERLVHVVRDHEGGFFVASPEFNENLLELHAGKRVEHAGGFIE